MGSELPAATRCKICITPHGEVIAIIGDGGFQMTSTRIRTIFQTKTPVKIVVLNNEFLGMVRQWQELFFDKRYASTTMVNPDFQQIVKGYEIKTKKVTQREQLNSAVKEMFEFEGAYFLEVSGWERKQCISHGSNRSSVSEIRLR